MHRARINACIGLDGTESGGNTHERKGQGRRSFRMVCYVKNVQILDLLLRFSWPMVEIIIWGFLSNHQTTKSRKLGTSWNGTIGTWTPRKSHYFCYWTHMIVLDAQLCFSSTVSGVFLHKEPWYLVTFHLPEGSISSPQEIRPYARKYAREEKWFSFPCFQGLEFSVYSQRCPGKVSFVPF